MDKKAFVPWCFGLVAAASLALVAFGLLTTQPRRVAAAAPPAAPGPAAVVMQAAIFTDTYDTPVINDSPATASNLGVYNIVPCSSPAPIASSATFWRAGLPNPANDVDYYRVQLGGQLVYTLTVAPQVPSDLRFFLQLVDPVGNVIYSSADQASHRVNFYNLNAGVYTLNLRASNAGSIVNTESKPYLITLCSSLDLITPTPTNTTIPATNTPIPGNVPDAYEPNDDIAEASVPAGNRSTASFIAVGASIPNLSFFPFNNRGTDLADWFQFYGRAGSIYQIDTTNVQPGVETVLFVYQPDGTTLVTPLPGSTNPNNRTVPGQRGSQVLFRALGDGLHWIQVVNTDPSPRVPGQTYTLSALEILIATATPSVTPTPGPPPTPFPGGADRFEYNGDFDYAGLIAPNVEYKDLNFVPWNPPSRDTVDNDFYRLPVKQGVYYTCRTLDLSPGTDTNIIIFNQDRVGIGGNDDANPNGKFVGDFASQFTWLSGYTGYAYILVGEVNPPRADEGLTRSYSLLCTIGLPSTPTPTSGPPLPTFEPPPPEPTMTPYPTPLTAQNLAVRPVQPTPSGPAFPPTPTPRAISLNVQVFNDPNRSGVAEPGEGIANVSVRVSDEATGLPLAQGATDADGRVNFALQNDGPVRLSVPLFGYTALIAEPVATVRIAVNSAFQSPPRLP